MKCELSSSTVYEAATNKGSFPSGFHVNISFSAGITLAHNVTLMYYHRSERLAKREISRRIDWCPEQYRCPPWRLLASICRNQQSPHSCNLYMHMVWYASSSYNGRSDISPIRDLRRRLLTRFETGKKHEALRVVEHCVWGLWWKPGASSVLKTFW